MVDEVFDESSQVDEMPAAQLSQEDTLINRGVADVLDEGIVPADNWSPLQGYGNTPAEMKQGLSLIHI